MQIKKILRWLIPTLLLATLAYLLGYSNLLVIQKITINQAGQSSDVSNVLSRTNFHIKIGEKMARVNTKGAENYLSKIGWVAMAKVSRNWFSRSISVTITARKPVAKLQAGAENIDQYIDSTGTIYKSSVPNLPLPIVQLSSPEDANIAANFISQTPPEILGNMQVLTVDGTGNLSMQVQNNGKSLIINWGVNKNVTTKAAIFSRLIALPENNKISMIDLSDPKYPIVKN